MGILFSQDGVYFGGGLPRGCPLAHATHGAADGGGLTLANARKARMWHNGLLLPCCPGLAALLRWHQHALTLSGETDCLTLVSPGGDLLVTAPCGMYPQDACIDGGTVYIAGGADGRVHRLTLPELRETGTYDLSGLPERISVCRNSAWVLSLETEGEMHTMLLRLPLTGGVPELIARLPGIPGAVYADSGGVWAASTETLVHFPPDGTYPDRSIGGFSLITQIAPATDGLLLRDGPEERTALLRLAPAPAILVFDRESG